MHAVRRGTIVAAATSGTQSITISSLASMGEVPKGARIWVTWATTNATDTDEARWSDYFVDSAGNTAGVSAQSEHNQATSDTDAYGADDGTVVAIISDTGMVKDATFTQWVAGGMEITWTASVASAVLIHVEFIFGDEVQVAVGQTVGGEHAGPDTDVITGFRPDHIETVAHVGDYNEAIRAGWNVHRAHVVRTTSLGVDGAWLLQESRTALGTTQLRSIHGSGTTPIVVRSFRSGTYSTISGMLYNGFSCGVGGLGLVGTFGHWFAYMAITYGGRNRYSLSTITAPTVTGMVAYETGWTPWVIQAIMTARTATGQNITNDSSAIGLGFANFWGDEFCAYTTDEDAAATSDTQSRSENDKLLRIASADGATVKYVANVDSWDACGFVLDWTTVNGDESRVILFVLERDHISGCAHATGPFPSSTATGLAGFVGNGSAQAPFPSASGQGTPGYIASPPANLVAPFPSASGAGFVGSIGSATAIAPFPAAKGFAKETFQGAACQRAPFPSAAGSGALTIPAITGSIAAVAPFPSASGLGLTGLIGGIAAQAPFPAVKGFAREVFKAVARMRAPFPTVDASGVMTPFITGTGSAVAPFPTASGLGTVTGGGGAPVTGSITAVAPFPTVKGFGREVFKAAGCLRAPFPVPSGVGILGFTGSGAAVAPFPSSSATGAESFIGAGAAVAPFPSVAGSGAETFSGAGSIVAPFPSAAGAGAETLIGNGAAQAPFPTVDGLGATDAPPIEGCSEVDLLAEYDGEVSLVAEYDAEVNLVGEHDGETDLEASYEMETDLDAEYDDEANVTAECS